MKLEIWIWTHEWEDDHSVSLYHSEAAARGGVQAYVQDQWREGGMEDTEIPGDLNEAVKLYFDIMGGSEWYNIERQFVDLPAPPQDKDTVDLNPQEVKAVIFALGNISYVDAAKELDVFPNKAQEIIDSAYNKLAD